MNNISKFETRGKNISLAKRMKIEDFMKRANEVHGCKYDYSNVVYVNAHVKIDIICPVHGTFSQRPGDHVRGKNGCPECGKLSRNKNHSLQAFQKFLTVASKHHNHKYTYIESSFTSITEPMSIICPVHGIFRQSPDVHKRAGCQRCGSGPVSETSQKWLDTLGVPITNREQWITINQKRIKVDGFDPITNTVYEFWGSYWHGNPRVYLPEKVNAHNKLTFKELYQQTLDRIALIESAGYSLIQIWEDEWLYSSNNSTAGQIIR